MKLATLNNWTPARAHKFAMVRIKRIEHALMEIGAAYGGVDNSVVYSADELRNSDMLQELRASLDAALEEGRSL